MGWDEPRAPCGRLRPVGSHPQVLWAEAALPVLWLTPRLSPEPLRQRPRGTGQPVSPSTRRLSLPVLPPPLKWIKGKR